MAEPELDDLTEGKMAGVAAQDFVDAYYTALNSAKGRASIAEFYLKPVPGSPLQVDIIMNGVPFTDPIEVQSKFEKEISHAFYEANSFDPQVINANYNVGASETSLAPNLDGKKISVLVMVSGTVKYSEAGDVHSFVDNVILVPNWLAQSPKSPKGLKGWLVRSQNFRLVV